MDHGWQIPPAFVKKTRDRLRAAEPGGIPDTIARVRRRRRPKPQVLPPGDVEPLAARRGTDAAAEGKQPVDETDGKETQE